MFLHPEPTVHVGCPQSLDLHISPSIPGLEGQWWKFWYQSPGICLSEGLPGPFSAPTDTDLPSTCARCYQTPVFGMSKPLCVGESWIPTPLPMLSSSGWKSTLIDMRNRSGARSGSPNTVSKDSVRSAGSLSLALNWNCFKCSKDLLGPEDTQPHEDYIGGRPLGLRCSP